MKKFAIALIVIAALPYLVKLNGTNKQASTNVSWVLDAWASRDSTLGDTTVFKASKKILPRSGVVIGAPYAPRNTFPGGRVDSLYVNHLNVSSVVSQIGSATAAAGVDSNLILDGGIAGSDLAGTLNGNKTFSGVITSAGPGASFAAGTITVSASGSLTSTAAGATTALGTTTVTSGFTATGLVDSSDITSVGSDDIPSTITGNKIFTGSGTFLGAVTSTTSGVTNALGSTTVTAFTGGDAIKSGLSTSRQGKWLTILIKCTLDGSGNQQLSIVDADQASSGTSATFVAGFHTNAGTVSLGSSTTSAGDTDANSAFWDTNDTVFRIKKDTGTTVTGQAFSVTKWYGDVDLSSIQCMRAYSAPSDVNFTGSPSSLIVEWLNSSGADVFPWSLLSANKSAYFLIQGVAKE